MPAFPMNRQMQLARTREQYTWTRRDCADRIFWCDVKSEHRIGTEMIEQFRHGHRLSSARTFFGWLEEDDEVMVERLFDGSLNQPESDCHMNVMATGVHHPFMDRGKLEARLFGDR